MGSQGLNASLFADGGPCFPVSAFGGVTEYPVIQPFVGLAVVRLFWGQVCQFDHHLMRDFDPLCSVALLRLDPEPLVHQVQVRRAQRNSLINSGCRLKDKPHQGSVIRVGYGAERFNPLFGEGLAFDAALSAPSAILVNPLLIGKSLDLDRWRSLAQLMGIVDHGPHRRYHLTPPRIRRRTGIQRLRQGLHHLGGDRGDWHSANLRQDLDQKTGVFRFGGIDHQGISKCQDRFFAKEVTTDLPVFFCGTPLAPACFCK